MGLILLNHLLPPPKEQGEDHMQVTRNHQHTPKSNDLLVRHLPLCQTKVEAHPMLDLPHLHRQTLQTATAILHHNQQMKASPEANSINADAPAARTWKKERQKFMTTNTAGITVNEKDITDPEPHHHPALALRTTALTTRVQVTPMVGYLPLTPYPPSLKNS